MDGLETQFDPHWFDAVELCQNIQHLFIQAVWPGCDRKDADIRMGNCLLIHGPQTFRRGIGIGIGLEIGDVSAALIFGGGLSLTLLNLPGDGQSPV